MSESNQLKSGEHPQTVLECSREGCARKHSFDVADQIPSHWYCSEHHPENRPVPYSKEALEAVVNEVPKIPEVFGDALLKAPKLYHRSCDMPGCQKFISLPEGTTRDEWRCVEHYKTEQPKPIVSLNPQAEETIKVKMPLQCAGCNSNKDHGEYVHHVWFCIDCLLRMERTKAKEFEKDCDHWKEMAEIYERITDKLKNIIERERKEFKEQNQKKESRPGWGN